jgi:hypothetical protein
MAGVLTTASTVLCGPDVPPNHGGTVAVSSTAKLKVNGNPVLIKSSIAGKSVGGCKTPQSNSTKPCTTVSSVLSGEASKLKAGGSPVMLDSTLSGQTDGAPPGTLSASAGQNRLTAI